MEGKGSSDFKVRIVWLVVRASRLVPWTIVFAAVFITSAFIVSTAEPQVGGFPNAAWLMFQVVTTIGLGDFTCTSAVGRIAVVALSVYSVFFFALITSVVVSYCLERMRQHRDESIAHFIDKLEHLSDLSKEELDGLSEQVRKFDAAHSQQAAVSD